MLPRILTLLLGGLLALPAAAAAPFTPQVGLSGFLDLQIEPDADGRERRVHRLGQAELDVDAEIAPRVGLCLAPSWDPVTEAFGVGTAALNLQFSPGDLVAVCRDRGPGWTGLLVGRFDVPFGIDWMLYPSLDRPLVTMPLPVAATHGGWNADGVLLYGAAGAWNALVHSTTGFDHSRVLDSGGEGIWTGRHALGGRLGWVPAAGIALGASAAAIQAVEDRHSQFLAGGDLFVRRGPASLRGEFLRLRTRADEVHLDHGWYLAGQWDLGGPYAIVRWDAWQPEHQAHERRVSWGAGVPLHGAVMVRAEYEWWPGAANPDRLVLQVAAGFRDGPD